MPRKRNRTTATGINADWTGSPEMNDKTPRQKMPEQDPAIRVNNFHEVPLGYTPETAVLEAGRCLQCKKPQCVEGCPVNVDIPAFIKEIAERNFIEAIRIIKKTNSIEL